MITDIDNITMSFNAEKWESREISRHIIYNFNTYFTVMFFYSVRDKLKNTFKLEVMLGKYRKYRGSIHKVGKFNMPSREFAVKIINKIIEWYKIKEGELRFNQGEGLTLDEALKVADGELRVDKEEPISKTE